MRLMKLACVLFTSVLIGCSSAGKSGGDAAAGYQPLFNGKTLNGFHKFGTAEKPTNWAVKDGTIVYTGKGGDLCTDAEYSDFDIIFEWKISEGGNSGVLYRVSEKSRPPMTGPEYQVLDNSKHKDGQNPKTSAGANYALIAPPKDYTKPVGQWNSGRILVKGNHVEHYLNGQLTAAYELHSAEWKQLVAASKFKQWPGYGMEPKGHIVFQDHGNEVAFRNIKIRIP